MQRKFALLSLALAVAVFANGDAGLAKSKKSAKGTDAAAILAKRGDCKTELENMKKAGTLGVLSGKGPITVFCPTDAAYGKIPKEMRDQMASDPKKLAETTKYHVLPRKVASSDIQPRAAVCTMVGECLMTNVKDGKPSVDGCLVSEWDIPCSNGIIHMIDAVPIPERGK